MSRILITVPTWNEALVIQRNLEILKDRAGVLLPTHDVQIEVVDNGSTDATREIVQAERGVTLLALKEKGKGLAIRRSWERHLDDADVLVFMDADLAADVSALPALVDPIVRGEVDLVCGSRFVAGARVERLKGREFASRVYRFLQKMILHLPVQDAQCGFKAISASAARALLPLAHESGWMFDTELLALAAQQDYRIKEIPVAWIEHRDPKRRSAIHVFRDSWGFIRGLFRIRQRVGGRRRVKREGVQV